MIARAPRTPFFELTGLKLRLWPIILAAVLMQAMLWPAREGARWIFKHYAEGSHHQVWAFVALAEAFQLAAGLLPSWRCDASCPKRTRICAGHPVAATSASASSVASSWPW